MRTTALGLCAFLVGSTALAGDIPFYRQPDSVTVDVPPTEAGRAALCQYFERIDDATWRTESGARLTAQRYEPETDDFVTVQITVPPSNIDDSHAGDLYWSLEDACPHLESAG